jgi:outer membrane protein
MKKAVYPYHWQKFIFILVLSLFALRGAFARENDNELGWDFNIRTGVLQNNTPLVGSNSGLSKGALVLVNVAYYGERFFFYDREIGYVLQENNRYSLSVTGTTTEDAQLFDSKVYNRNNNTLKDLGGRHYSFNLGLEWLYSSDWGETELQLENDVSGVHKGQMITLSHGTVFGTEKWEIRPKAGLIWKSKNLVDYYYGVRDSEVKPDRPAYSGKDTLDWFLYVCATYPLSVHWNFITDAYFEQGGKGITDSPLVEEDNFHSVFVGLEYVF